MLQNVVMALLGRALLPYPCLYTPEKIMRTPILVGGKRVYLPQKQRTNIPKNILNISTVAGYQKGEPIKLVAYSANYIGS